jgi:hypothetical protein
MIFLLGTLFSQHFSGVSTGVSTGVNIFLVVLDAGLIQTRLGRTFYSRKRCDQAL